MPLALSISHGHSNEIPDFWDLAGPTLLHPETAIELGSHPKDDSDTVWFLATTEHSRTLLGFCAAKSVNRRVELRHDFVRPRYRRMGVYRTLLRFRNQWLEQERPAARHEIVTRNLWQIPYYQSLGFKVATVRGSFTVLSRDRQTDLLTLDT